MNKELKEHLGAFTRHLITLQEIVMEGTRKVEALRVTVEVQDRLVDKLSDKLVEMAMVNQGMGREAASHRRSQTVENEPSPPDADELWDAGCDVITMP